MQVISITLIPSIRFAKVSLLGCHGKSGRTRFSRLNQPRLRRPEKTVEIGAEMTAIGRMERSAGRLSPISRTGWCLACSGPKVQDRRTGKPGHPRSSRLNRARSGQLRSRICSNGIEMAISIETRTIETRTPTILQAESVSPWLAGHRNLLKMGTKPATIWRVEQSDERLRPHSCTGWRPVHSIQPEVQIRSGLPRHWLFP